MWNIISKSLLIATIIVAVGIYVSAYSNWSAAAGMLAGQLLMIVNYEIFAPYLAKLIDNYIENKESD